MKRFVPMCRGLRFRTCCRLQPESSFPSLPPYSKGPTWRQYAHFPGSPPSSSDVEKAKKVATDARRFLEHCNCSDGAIPGANWGSRSSQLSVFQIHSRFHESLPNFARTVDVVRRLHSQLRQCIMKERPWRRSKPDEAPPALRYAVQGFAPLRRRRE